MKQNQRERFLLQMLPLVYKNDASAHTIITWMIHWLTIQKLSPSLF